MLDLQSARHWAQELLRQAVPPGGAALDATMGNGFDTLFLCELVGERGRVYAFDVQPQALERTRSRLEEAGVADRARLILDGHQNAAIHVREPLDAAAFNLGWLPGVEKKVTTRAETTLAALSSCLKLLKPGGLLTVCAYPGHPEGARELQALLDWARALDGKSCQALVRAYLNQPPAAPAMIAVQRLK